MNEILCEKCKRLVTPRCGCGSLLVPKTIEGFPDVIVCMRDHDHRITSRVPRCLCGIKEGL